MRVEGPGKSNNISKTKKSSKPTKTGGSNFGSMISTTASEAEETAATQALSSIENLLVAQEFDDPQEEGRQGRMKQRAQGILKELDFVRIALLNGNLRMSHMERVSNAMVRGRERIQDPMLNDVLDEIDLRAQVEMAKLEMAKERAMALL